MTAVPAFDEVATAVIAAHITRWLADPDVDVAIAAWGTHDIGARALLPTPKPQVLLLARAASRALHCLGRTKNGHPKHPLYVETATHLEQFAPAPTPAQPEGPTP